MYYTDAICLFQILDLCHLYKQVHNIHFKNPVRAASKHNFLSCIQAKDAQWFQQGQRNGSELKWESVQTVNQVHHGSIVTLASAVFLSKVAVGGLTSQWDENKEKKNHLSLGSAEINRCWSFVSGHSRIGIVPTVFMKGTTILWITLKITLRRAAWAEMLRAWALCF